MAIHRALWENEYKSGRMHPTAINSSHVQLYYFFILAPLYKPISANVTWLCMLFSNNELVLVVRTKAGWVYMLPLARYTVSLMFWNGLSKILLVQAHKSHFIFPWFWKDTTVYSTVKIGMRIRMDRYKRRTSCGRTHTTTRVREVAEKVR